MPPELYLYLRRCHGCQRHRLESGSSHVPLSLTQPLLPLSLEGGTRVNSGKGLGPEGLDPNFPISPMDLRRLEVQPLEPQSPFTYPLLPSQSPSLGKTQASGCPALGCVGGKCEAWKSGSRRGERPWRMVRTDCSPGPGPALTLGSGGTSPSRLDLCLSLLTPFPYTIPQIRIQISLCWLSVMDTVPRSP